MRTTHLPFKERLACQKRLRDLGERSINRVLEGRSPFNRAIHPYGERNGRWEDWLEQ